MATSQRKLFVTPQQIAMDKERFAASPYRAISRFLECFDRNGRLEIEVPHYVLEAIAERFILVNSEQLNNLDAAFGGCIARQRNAARKEERDWDIHFEVLRRSEKERALPGEERGIDSPVRTAMEECAEANDMKPGGVRQIIYGKKRGRF